MPTLLMLALSGCSYYTRTPETGTICKSHGRSYVKHFSDVSGSKNYGAYFTRDTLQYLIDDKNIKGVGVFIGCEDSLHPIIIEVENGITDAIKIKGSKKCYLSSKYINRECFNAKDQNCTSINNYSNSGKCEVTGVFFTKDVIENILKNKKFNGLVVYIGLDAAGNYPLIMQGTKCKPDPSDIHISSTYSIVSKTYCPKSCGSLLN